MLDEPVLIDTGAFAAMFDPRDRFHAVCVEQFANLPVGKAYSCWPVITEAAYLTRNYPAQQGRLLDGVAAGDFPLLVLTEGDVPKIQANMAKYRDQEVDLADAALVHLANREGINAIFTLDRRHFNVYRRSDGNAFRIMPELS